MSRMRLSALSPGQPALGPPGLLLFLHGPSGLLPAHAAPLWEKIALPLVDAEEQVALVGPGEQALVPDGLQRGPVHPVVPIRGDLLGREDLPALLHHVVAMDLDQLEELDVSLGAAELDPGLGASPLEAALLHEHPLLLLHDELGDVGTGGQWPPSPQPGDFRVDEVDPL